MKCDNDANQKCVVAWYAFGGIAVVHFLINSCALFYVTASSKVQSLHLLRWMTDDFQAVPLISHAVLWLLCLGFGEIILFVFALILIGWVEKHPRLETPHEFLTYIVVASCTTLLAVSVGDYSGVFSAVPFVVFSIGASQTRSYVYFLLTLLIHGVIYVAASHLCGWGVSWHDLKSSIDTIVQIPMPPWKITGANLQNVFRTMPANELQYFLTVAVVYFCIFLIKTIERIYPTLPQFLSISVGKLKQKISGSQLLSGGANS